jgi:SAM-dependent methyltransferase
MRPVRSFRELSRSLRDRAETLVRRTWMKYAIRGTARADAHRRLELAYRLRDPWKMDSDTERFRFARTNELLHHALIEPSPRVGSILEIGCGEGHQSEHLIKLCDRLTGIDVSATAIARARQRLPSAELIAGDLFTQPWIDETDRFDLVTAFEVLYYIQDVPRTLAAMSRLGKACAITYFAPAARVLDRELAGLRVDGRERFRHGEVEWQMLWWRSPRAGPTGPGA